MCQELSSDHNDNRAGGVTWHLGKALMLKCWLVVRLGSLHRMTAWKWGWGFTPEGMSSQTGTCEGKWFVLSRKWAHTSGWGWPSFFLSLVPRKVVPRLQITERSGWFCMGEWAVSWLFWVWFRVIGIIQLIIFHSPVSVAERRDTAFLEQPASKLKILQRLKGADPFQQPRVDCERRRIRPE